MTNTPYPEDLIRRIKDRVFEDSGRYQPWSLLQEIPNTPLKTPFTLELGSAEREAAYELKGKFLDDLRNNALCGTNGEDAVEHIKNFLKIVDPLDLPDVSYKRLRLVVFPISLIGVASEWLMNEPQISITTWEDLTDKFFGKYCMPSRNVLTDAKLSDLEETYEVDKKEIAEIFRIESDILDYETPLCKAFNEFNYLFPIDPDVLNKDIIRFKTYEEYKDD
ncbi:hypothetical protein Tco_0017527 [Tanacetum coccineum]